MPEFILIFFEALTASTSLSLAPRFAFDVSALEACCALGIEPGGHCGPNADGFFTTEALAEKSAGFRELSP